MRHCIIFLTFIIPAFCFSQDSLKSHYKIYSTSKQKFVTVDEIVSQMNNADVLFFGENHNDSTAHYLEMEIFKRLAIQYPKKVTLSMEMFETDCQNVLDEYLAGFIREKNFITEARTWHNYKDYRPLIEYAKLNHIEVIAANVPARYTNMVSSLGLSSLEKLNKTSKSYLPPLPIDTATGPYYDKFVQIMGGHASMGGMQMYQAQNLWDATMGWSIANYYKSQKGIKILQLNGSFHSEERLGTIAQLKKYSPKIRILNIATFSDENFENPDWIKLGKNGDFIIVTDPKLPKTF